MRSANGSGTNHSGGVPRHGDIGETITRLVQEAGVYDHPQLAVALIKVLSEDEFHRGIPRTTIPWDELVREALIGDTDAGDGLHRDLERIEHTLHERLEDAFWTRNAIEQLAPLVAARLRIRLADCSRLNRMTVPSYAGYRVPDANASGPVATSASERLHRLLDGTLLHSGAIGLAGPRGVGKTTLIHHLCPTEAAAQTSNRFSVVVDAPVSYDTQEFVAHLADKSTTELLKRGGVDGGEPREHRRRGTVVIISGIAGVAAGLALLAGYAAEDGSALRFATVSVAVFLLSVGVAAVVPRRQKKSDVATDLASALRWPNGRPVAGDGVQPKVVRLLGGAAILLAGLMAIWGVTFHASRPELALALGILFLSWLGLLVGGELNRHESRTPLWVLEARERLDRLRSTRTFQSSSTQSLKVTPNRTPIQAEVSQGRSTSRSEHAMTLIELVDAFKATLAAVPTALKVPHAEVVIGIDELDKMEPAIARRFLDDVKQVFGGPPCYFLVSVSEDALASFERRGMPIRDVFDTAFVEVVHMGYMSYPGTRRLLGSRCVGLPPSFVGFCHCTGGGLPRDVLRAMRRALDYTRSHDETKVKELTRRLIRDDLAAKRDAVITTLRGLGDGASVEGSLAWAGAIIAHSSSRSDLLAASTNGLWRPDGATLVDADSDKRQARALRLEAELAAFLYLSMTVEESIDGLTANSVKTFIQPDGLMDVLAGARRSFALHPSLAWTTTSKARELAGFDVHAYPLTADVLPGGVTGDAPVTGPTPVPSGPGSTGTAAA
jgi:hypothetical protein